MVAAGSDVRHAALQSKSNLAGVTDRKLDMRQQNGGLLRRPCFGLKVPPCKVGEAFFFLTCQIMGRCGGEGTS